MGGTRMRAVVAKTVISMLACTLVSLAGSGSAPALAATGTGSVWNATQTTGKPASFYWAALIGARDYSGSTADAPGADADVYSMRDHLVSLGWMPDHIFIASNLSATRATIVKAIGWLASKTNNRSEAIFMFSGHEKPFRTSADGDSEARDVALWGSDNQYLLDGDLGRELAKVRAYKMWINLSTCRSGGFADAGTLAPNRVVTYSSPESELSYADASVRHSIFSYYMIVMGMQNMGADLNHDGKVSVEEAFVYSRPLITDRTGGLQHPQMIDRFSGDFSITPPAA